jgi:hypothetical protein
MLRRGLELFQVACPYRKSHLTANSYGLHVSARAWNDPSPDWALAKEASVRPMISESWS